VNAPNMMAASHTTRRRPASAQAHSGRRAASSSAHAVSARGTLHASTTAMAPAVADGSMAAAS
jgi:hypothetical protein